MNIMIFDTETTNLDKPFCYNIGYIIASENGEVLTSADYVVEQIWHNLPLFYTAYYADKRPLYVKSMRARKTKMDKFGYICRKMLKDIKQYNVVGAYAYNSPFDERVFQFNCEWYKCVNPFENIPIFDIRGYAHHFICKDDYKTWCEENKRFTDSQNYSTTAESVYQYIAQDTSFEEEHTALSDSVIETAILFDALSKGAKLQINYPPFYSLQREILKPFTVKLNGETVFSQEVKSIRYMKNNNAVLLRD